MNITVIYATSRKTKSCTYGIAQWLLKELLGNGRLYEFYLPKDMPHVCTGCYGCFMGKEEKCGGAAAASGVVSERGRGKSQEDSGKCEKKSCTPDSVSEGEEPVLFVPFST